MAKTLVGGLIERKSNDDDDGVDDEPLVKGLSQDIRMFSIPRPASTKISGVVERLKHMNCLEINYLRNKDYSSMCLILT